MAHLFLLQIDVLQCDVSQLQSTNKALWADVVIMNPPFGTRRKGADLEFLRAAFQVSSAFFSACLLILRLTRLHRKQRITKGTPQNSCGSCTAEVTLVEEPLVQIAVYALMMYWPPYLIPCMH